MCDIPQCFCFSSDTRSGYHASKQAITIGVRFTFGRRIIFGNFDFSCLDDPEYKEDSVREDIIAPLLRAVGFSASKPHRIIRSRALTHPYVLFGSQKRKINIIPDYVLEVDDQPSFVLDAKAPSQEITTGDNVAQVFSYAIHPEIRAFSYGLCNGKTLALFHINSIKPKHVYDLTSLGPVDLLDISQKLNPRTLRDFNNLNFTLDGGLYLHVAMNIPMEMELHFPGVIIPYLGMINHNHFSISVSCNDMASRPLAFSFDFDKHLFDKLLSQLSPSDSKRITDAMSARPFSFHDPQTPPSTHIKCKQTTQIEYSRSGEMFVPLKVLDFLPYGESQNGN